jgi:periplasmic divalent cation tolerance protein
MDKTIPHESSPCAVVLTTVADRDTAVRVARDLVERRLAACVQIVDGLQSIYRWEGRLDEARECQLAAKTPRDRVDALVAALRAAHPYEVPEIVVLDGIAHGPYAAWLATETTPEGG